MRVEAVAPDAHRFGDAVAEAVARRLASRIGAQDATVWGPDAESEAAIRLSWTDLASSSRPLIAEIEELRESVTARGLDHVVLCGMGGSSLAPEVICATAGVPLTVLDSSDPDMVRHAIEDRLDRTVVVVSSKSGGTVETDSQRRAYEAAFRSAGIDPAERIVVVTDPGSGLEETAREAGYRTFLADPHVGGRYSALTAFGLVPTGLAGVDIEDLLDGAALVRDAVFADDPANPALRLGVLMGLAQRHGVDKLVLADRSGLGFGDWIEQLVAESTGKLGTGILPVVVPSTNAVNFQPSTHDGLLVALNAGEAPESQSGYAVAVQGDLAALMLVWEAATAIAGALIGINPFDQPDVESAKQAARDLLGSGGSLDDPDGVDGDIEIRGSSHGTVEAAVADLLDELDLDRGYLAVHVYLDRITYADFAGVRELLAERTGRPVTFGWGPRFLHSTGQFHKGGTPVGVFLQITGEPAQDLDVPGRDFTFGGFLASQAAGDASVLAEHGRPVLRLHLRDVTSGLVRLRTVLS